MNFLRWIVVAVCAVTLPALAGCAGGERAIAGTGRLSSIDERPSLSNPLKAEKGPARRPVRRGTGIASRDARRTP
jgi:hypothetical protein